MPKYTVYGDMVVTYRINLDATNEDEAYELSESRPTIDWERMTMDETISPYEVEEVQEYITQ